MCEKVCVCAHVCLRLSGDPHAHLEATGEGISFESSQAGIWVRRSLPGHCSLKPGKPVSAASSPLAGAG